MHCHKHLYCMFNKHCKWISIAQKLELYFFLKCTFIKKFAPLCKKRERERYLIQTDYFNLSVTTYLINLKKPERERKKSIPHSYGISFGHRKKIYVLYFKCSVCTVIALLFEKMTWLSECSMYDHKTYMNIIIVISRGINSLKSDINWSSVK